MLCGTSRHICAPANADKDFPELVRILGMLGILGIPELVRILFCWSVNF